MGESGFSDDGDGRPEWALRRVEADITPNLKTVAPAAGALPRYVEPPPPGGKNRGDRQQLKPAPESPGICLGRAGWSEKEERRAELTRVVLASEPLPIPPAASISSALRGRYGLGNCRPKRACRLLEFR